MKMWFLASTGLVAIALGIQQVSADSPCFYYYTQDSAYAYSSCDTAAQRIVLGKASSSSSSKSSAFSSYSVNVINSENVEEFYSRTRSFQGRQNASQQRCFFFYTQDDRARSSCTEEEIRSFRLSGRGEVEGRLTISGRREERSSSSGGSGGLLGRSAGRCSEKRSILAFIPQDRLHCGPGYTFPFLMNGDCPISACQIRVNNTGFGGSLDF